MTADGLLEKAAALDAATMRALSLAWDTAWHAEGSPGPAAHDAARHAAIAAGRDWAGVRRQAWDAVFRSPHPAGYPARRAVSDAAHAVLARDLITDAEFAALAGPWTQATGETP